MTVSPVRADDTLDPKAVADEVAAHGAAATIQDLTARDQWDTVTENISAGKAEWIDLVPSLAPGGDAGNGEEIDIALAYALPKNATAVLKAIDATKSDDISAKRVCSIPFIEDSVPDLPIYKQSALKAVDDVADATLQATKDHCHAELDAAPINPL